MTRTLVLVHGFMGSALIWGPILTRLKSRSDLHAWTFLTPDLLGHGGRRGPEALHDSTLNHAKLVEDFKTQLPASGDMILLGHSFGLRPILSVAADPTWAPRIKALIVEDASPEITADNARSLRAILGKVPVPFGSRAEAKAKIETLFPEDPRLAAFLFSNIRALGDEGHTWRFDKSGLVSLLNEAENSPLWSEWSNYSGPIYIMRGEHSDHLTPDRLKRALEKRGVLETHLVQIAQSGHWIHSDQPDRFTEEL
ncbi:MAG: alpha/beta hydrolase, partial [Bdellovibrionota bacterium]